MIIIDLSAIDHMKLYNLHRQIKYNVDTTVYVKLKSNLKYKIKLLSIKFMYFEVFLLHKNMAEKRLQKVCT